MLRQIIGLLSFLTLLKTPAMASNKLIAEGVPASNNTVYVDTANIRLGVGTKTPGSTFEVTGTSLSVTSGGVQIGKGNNNGAALTVYDGGRGQSFEWENVGRLSRLNGNAAISPLGSADININNGSLYIKQSGNVGIGNTNPSSPLSVQYAGNSTLGAGGGIRLDSTGGAGKWNTLHLGGTLDDAYVGFLTNNSASTRLLGFGNNIGGGNPQMVIDGNGNVGINQTSPSSALEVNGTITLTSGSGGCVTFQDGSSQCSSAGSITPGSVLQTTDGSTFSNATLGPCITGSTLPFNSVANSTVTFIFTGSMTNSNAGSQTMSCAVLVDSQFIEGAGNGAGSTPPFGQTTLTNAGGNGTYENMSFSVTHLFTSTGFHRACITCGAVAGATGATPKAPYQFSVTGGK